MDDLSPFFRSVIDQDDMPVVICNTAHEIVYMNPAAEEHYADRGGRKLIGLIIFDEVQNLSFAQSTDKSFEAILELVNETKVAFDIVGTEDAGDKLLANLRMARRMGAEINANAYCGSRVTFDRIIDFVFQYQWFKKPVEPTKEIKDAMYKYTRGIIDQVITLYQYMQIDYILAPVKRKDRPIDGEYVRRVSEKHFAGMSEILARAEYDLQAAAEGERLRSAAKDEIERLSAMKKEENAIQEFETTIGKHNEITAIRDSVIDAIMLTSAYSDKTIRIAFNAVTNTPQGKAAVEACDKRALAKLTTERLKQTALQFGARKKPEERKELTSFLDDNTEDPLA